MAKTSKILIKNELPIELVGIICNESDLRLSSELNKSLDIKLSRVGFIKPINAAADADCDLAVYQHTSETGNLRLSLIQNRPTPCYYFEEFKQIDFFFIIRGEKAELDIHKLIQNIRELKGVESVLQIPITSIKKKEKLEIF